METLAVSRLKVKHPAASKGLGHRFHMRRAKKREPKSHLQAIFMKRVAEEMEKQQVSGLGLSKREGAPPQRTLADVLNGADPRLETVEAFAKALGVMAVDLLTEVKKLPDNVRKLPGYPPIIGRDEKQDRQFVNDRKMKRR